MSPDTQSTASAASKGSPRKIGVTHMAFYRGWLQGMPLREVADLYLETGLDLRRAKSTLTWVQDTLRRAALRNGRKGEARLLRLRINAGRQAKEPANLPSIDDFREDVDPTGFYSFDELMTQYLERYPSAGNEKAKKRARLLQRQIDTLNWLEALLVTEPVPADPLEAWLDDNIAKRLQNADIFTFEELIRRMKERGYRWYTTVDQLGERTAKSLAKWIQGYRESLGELPRTVLVKPQELKPLDKARSPVILSGPAPNPHAPQIVPLEAMLLPLRGSVVEPNQPRQDCRIHANNDREAVEEWLRSGSGSPSTMRAYKKEAERLVLWAMIERGKTLAQMEPDDCASYRDWLCALGRLSPDDWPYRIPQEQWMAPRYIKRHSPAWRPFEAALSAKSVIYALTTINTMFRWLVDVRYLDFNPWRVISKPRALAGDAPDTEFVRAMSKDQWGFLMGCVMEMDDAAAGARAHLLLKLALVTGMRLAELTDAVYGRVYTMPLKEGGQRWMLKVLGKGAKWRSAPLTDEVVSLMRHDLRLRGLPDDPQAAGESTPIIARLDGGPLSIGGMAKLVKGLFHRAQAKLIDAGRVSEARVFGDASTHWIRHTTGSMLADSGVPASLIQQLLGHASIATTTIYTSTTEDKVWHAVVDNL